MGKLPRQAKPAKESPDIFRTDQCLTTLKNNQLRNPKDQADGPSKVAAALRPLAKEVIKGGLLAYSAITDSLAGIGKQVTEMVDEAKAELDKKEPPNNKTPSNDSSS